MKKRNVCKKTVILMVLLSLLSLNTMFAQGQQGEAKAEELTLWHTSFVNEWSGREEAENYFKEHNTVPVKDDYGPALYREVSKQFIIQAKTGTPDVLEGVHEQLFTYAKAGLLLPLDEYFAEDPDSSSYGSNVIEPLKFQGKLYGLPYNTNVRLLLYRKSILEKYNLEVPATWEELVETAAYINENEPDMQGFIFTTKTREVRAFQEFMSFYLQLNKHMFKVEGDTVTYTAEKGQLEEVLDLYHSMFFDGGINLDERGGDWKALDYGYTGGKFAMTTVGPWIWSHRFDDPARGEVLDDTGIAALPVHPDGTPGTYMEIKPIMINAHTEDPDAAYKLLKEVTSKDFQIMIDKLAGVLPGRLDALNAPQIKNDPWMGGFAEYADTGVALDPISWDKPINAIISAIQYTIYEEKSVVESAAWLDAELKKISKEL